MNTLDLIILFLIIAIIYSVHHKRTSINEGMSSTHSSNKPKQSESSADDEKPSDKRADVKQVNILEDPAFSDIVFHKSDRIIGQNTGLDKCLNSCNGICTEFGITGDAMCYGDVV